jgi:hypothetical protein
MNIPRNFRTLKKLTARALLAGGLSVAVLWLGTGIANADPSLWCPQPNTVVPVDTGTVCISESYQNDRCLVSPLDLIPYTVTAPSGQVIGQRIGTGLLRVTWPISWSQPQNLPPGLDPRLHVLTLNQPGVVGHPGCIVETALCDRSSSAARKSRCIP